jgi:Rod binding domain-containing protein
LSIPDYERKLSVSSFEREFNNIDKNEQKYQYQPIHTPQPQSKHKKIADSRESLFTEMMLKEGITSH